MDYIGDIFGTIRPVSRPVWLHRIGVLVAFALLSALVTLILACILTPDGAFDV